MGMTFSNLYIKKNDNYNLENLKDWLTKDMAKQGYTAVENAKDSEISMLIYAPSDSSWISLASDSFMLYSASDIKKTAKPISKAFETDVLTASCMDSDFLLLHLLNAADHTDAWAKIGSLYGMETGKPVHISAWEKKVPDIFQFSKIIKTHYTFAEEALYELADKAFAMLPEQCCLYVNDTLRLEQTALTRLYFALPETSQTEPPRIEIPMYGLMPCKIGESSCVFAVNKGGASKGISIAFTGDFIENDDLTFENITFESNYGSDDRKIISIQPEKVRQKGGGYMLYWEDPDFPIPPKANPKLPISQIQKLEFEREFGVRFTVQGNPRRLLDVTVFIMPLDKTDPASSACWYVWRYSGSKEQFIKDHNATWADKDSDQHLDMDDFDL